MVKITFNDAELEFIYLGLLKLKADQQLDEIKIRIQDLMDYIVFEDVAQEHIWGR